MSKSLKDPFGEMPYDNCVYGRPTVQDIIDSHKEFSEILESNHKQVLVLIKNDLDISSPEFLRQT